MRRGRHAATWGENNAGGGKSQWKGGRVLVCLTNRKEARTAGADAESPGALEALARTLSLTLQLEAIGVFKVVK